MRSILFIIYLFISCMNLSAQRDSAAAPSKLSVKNKFIIAGGIGYSKMWLVYYKAYLSVGEWKKLLGPENISNVTNIFLEYGITKKSTIGVAASYTKSTGLYINEYKESSHYEDISRTTLTVQYRRSHFMNKIVEIYYGARLGITYWTDEIEDRLPDPSYHTYPSPPPAPTFLHGSPVYINGQVFTGIKLYPLRFVAVNIETGILTPYIAEVGLSLSF